MSLRAIERNGGRGGLMYNDYGWVGETRDNDLNVDYSYGTSTGPMSPIVR